MRKKAGWVWRSWRKPQLNAVGVLLFLLVSVALASAVNLVTNAPLPPLLQPLERHPWWFLGILLIIILGARGVLGARTAEGGTADEPKRWAHVRGDLIGRVHADWVEGVLQPSLSRLPRPVEARLTKHRSMVTPPQGLVLPAGSHAESPVPADTPPQAWLTRARGRLLVLGDPGTGKTTLLLRLAQALLETAANDPQARVPVVFHLSTWKPEARSFEAWLVDELDRHYGVPRRAARAFVEHGVVLPLADGLDELAEPRRAACAAAMNDYTSHPLVVCCRTVEYIALPERLRLNLAIAVEPLRVNDVRQWAESLGADGEPLRQLLGSDPVLGQLARTPLMLGAMATVAGGGRDVHGGDTGPDARRRRLLDTYVDAALVETPRARLAPGAGRFTPAQTRHWLAQLAALLHARDLTVYQPDWMQYDWAPSRRQAWLVAYGPLLVSSLLVMGVAVVGTIRHLSLFGAVLVAVGVTIFGYGVDNFRPETISPAERPHLAFRLGWPKYLALAMLLIVCWLSALGALESHEAPAAPRWVIAGFVGLIAGWPLFFFLGMSLRRGAKPALTPRRPLAGIHTLAWQGTVRGIIAAFQGLALTALLVLPTLTNAAMETDDRAEAQQSLPYIPYVVVIIALILINNSDGRGYIRHRLLRACLSRADLLPRDLIGLLDHASAHLLLYRVGGGYIFAHQLLRDHFADQAPTGVGRQHVVSAA
jgi:DNA polymerase III delta prime subunit